jgi:predicted  nucleic acid-binding Zn-ribbon protein
VLQLEAQVGELKPKLRAAEKEAKLARKDVEASADAKKVRKLREDLTESEKVQEALRRELAELKDEHSELGKLEAAVQREMADWRVRCHAAERKVQALSESQLQKDNTVLRSILERQKVELEQRFKELKRLRRAQLGLRLAYALFAMGMVALVLIVVPRLKDLGDWFME